MAVTVRIPTVLRRLAGDHDEIQSRGATVKEVLLEIGNRYPHFVRRVCLDDGGIRPFLNVYVNGHDIRFRHDLETTITDGDEISIIPSIAGGL